MIRKIIIGIFLTLSTYGIHAAHSIKNLQPYQPWMIYLGGSGGYYHADFTYGANHFSNGVVRGNQIFAKDITQQGYAVGGQAGIQYHFNNPYFIGVTFNMMTNTNKARTVQLIDGLVSGLLQAFSLNHALHINYSQDWILSLGADVVPNTHIYINSGVTLARFTDYLFVTQRERFPLPIPFFQATERKNLIGWLVGLGLAYDINRWLNVFAEYDYYGFPNQNLNTYNNIAPNPNQVDHTTQHVNLHAANARLGINVKLIDPSLPHFLLTQQAHWMLYLGAFGGIYQGYFDYASDYFARSVLNQNSQTYHTSSWQQGYSLGAQVGLQYHFNNPAFIGLTFSDSTNGNKARLTEMFEDVVSGTAALVFSIYHEMRINYNRDLATLLGVDITQQTHLYAKGGITFARLTDYLSTIDEGRFPYLLPFLQLTERKNLLGWLVGLGLTYDINRWLNAFAEYDYYGFPNKNLNSYNNISPDIGTAIDLLTQNIHLNASSIRFGFNVKLIDAAASVPHIIIKNPWMIYLGAIAGYFQTNVDYGGNFFTTFSDGNNFLYISNAAQQGMTYGGQVGIQYHFQSPYLIGLVFNRVTNTRTARFTSDFIDNLIAGNSFHINNEMRINYNNDLAAFLGINITQTTHGYLKGGITFARATERLFTTRAVNFPFPLPVFDTTTRQNLLGWIVGFGVTQDINRWLNVFIEYNYNGFPSQNLTSYENITPFRPNTQTDLFTQHVNFSSFSVRGGLNVTIRF